MKKKLFLETSDGNQIKLNTFPFQIGSFSDICNLTINNPNVSPIHCVINNDNGTLTVKEMNTNRGVQINDVNLLNGNSQEIKVDDQIKIVDSVFFLREEKSELFTAQEIEDLNNSYSLLLDNYKIEETSKELINILWNKIHQVFQIAKAEEDLTLINVIQNGYLNSIFAEDLGQLNLIETNNDLNNSFQNGIDNIRMEETVEPIEKENINKDIIEKKEDFLEKGKNVSRNILSGAQSVLNRQNIEKLKESLKGHNSFEVRRRRRTLDDELIHPEANIEEPVQNETSDSLNNRKVKIDTSKLNNPSSSQLNNEPRKPIKIDESNINTANHLKLRETRLPFTVINIEKTPFKIGKSAEQVDFTLNRKGISRVHAIIQRSPKTGGFILKDNNATNGTFLNDVRIYEETPVKKGDIIRFYDYSFKVI